MSNQHKLKSQGVTRARITENEAGQRIDNYLLRHFKGVPRSHIYRILRKGEVRINKKRIKPAYKLLAGDEIRLPPVRFSSNGPRRPPDEVIQQVESRIVYDDDRIFILNKPSGLAVHAGSGVDYGVIDAMQQLYKGAEGSGEVFLVHRLDRETSGCLLIARDRPAMLYLQQALKNGEISKHYATLLKGRWGQGREVIDLPLSRNKIKGGERLVQVDEEGKMARSIFNPVREYRQATLMKVELLTGRTHQIRVHAAESGFPVAGDRQYGDQTFNYEMKSIGLKRMFLHAQSLSFPHPDDGHMLTIDPPLDEDLQSVLDNLNVENER